MDVASVALLLAGFPLGRTRARKLTKPLSKFLVYVIAPILGFWAGVNASSTLPAFAAVLPELLVFYLARRMFEGCERRGGAALVSAFGNTIFLGIPAVLSFGGSLNYAVAYAMMTTLIHYTFASLYSCKGGSVAFKVQPFTVAFFAGLVLSPFSAALNRFLWTKHLAAQASKLGLLILGLSFETKHLKLDEDVTKVGFLKHLLLPTLTLPFALAGGTKALLVESSMPPAFMNIALAYVYGYDVDLVTKSVITLTLIWIALLIIISLVLLLI